MSNVVPLRLAPGIALVDEYVERVVRNDVRVPELPAWLVEKALLAELANAGEPTDDAIEHRERIADERRERNREFRVTGVWR